MSLSNDLDRKFFHALLNGLVQGHVFGKVLFTVEYLQSQLFGASALTPKGLSAFVVIHVGKPLRYDATRFYVILLLVNTCMYQTDQVSLMEEVLRLLQQASRDNASVEALDEELQQVRALQF
jgi:hypothetical protein